MSSGGDNDRHREHLGVSQTKQAKKKKSRRPIDPEDIAGSIYFGPERISHDTHLFVVPFGTADPRQYYPNYRRPVGGSSTSQALPSQRYEDLPLQAIHPARPLSADAMAGTPPLTLHFVHPDVSPSSKATPSATPDDTMHALAPGQKDRLGLEGIRSSHQAEALEGIKIAAMSAQIAKLTAALAESERRRVVEQESVSEIV
uniref:Uncharacterized protein n=1 Tax=Solanum tuberosum TaxID=4113 RepID=M1DR73_SOLTU